MLSAFAPNVQFLIFSYGIVVGEYAGGASVHTCSFFCPLKSHASARVSCAPVTRQGNTSPADSLQTLQG